MINVSPNAKFIKLKINSYWRTVQQRVKTNPKKHANSEAYDIYLFLAEQPTPRVKMRLN